LPGNRGHDKGDGVEKDRQCFRLPEQVDIILEADEGAHEGAQAEHVDFLKAHDDVVDERQPSHDEQEAQRKSDKDDI
jgi:hypothetical protein